MNQHHWLLDESKQKRDTDGIVYAVSPADVRDMMRRYDVMPIALKSGDVDST
jgi:hypothetical protein